ncbi:MAG: hypothetical protein OSJ43_06535 [Oscillospiraceae bacterium]|nr:hypothetical protein [Oscillospiraceae bacterium]
MSISVERKKEEAIKRMKLLGIIPDVIHQFEKDDLINRSEPPFGALYWVQGDDLKHLHKFEEEHNALVYAVIRNYYNIGTMDSYLYVSDYEKDWENDREELKNGEAFAYVRNLDDDECSEFGSIGVTRSPAAGLVRTW